MIGIYVLISIVSLLLVMYQYQFLKTENNVGTTTSIERRKIIPWCSREQVQQGFWTVITNHTDETSQTLLPPYRSTPWEETCYYKTNNENGENEYNHNYYSSTWNVNESCQLATWDPISFCHLLENKTLGFLGDSISWQVFRSMVRASLKVPKNIQ